MALPGETEAGSAGTQPCQGIAWRAHRDDAGERGSRLSRSSQNHIGSKDPNALKIPARRAECSLTGNARFPFQAEPEHDARALALYLSKNMLPEVRMKDKERGQLESLTQTRDTLVKLRTALKNKINNILSARGLNLAKEALGSEKKLDEVLELPFDEMVRIELRVIVEQIRSLNKSIAELEKTIGEEGSKLEGQKE